MYSKLASHCPDCSGDVPVAVNKYCLTATRTSPLPLIGQCEANLLYTVAGEQDMQALAGRIVSEAGWRGVFALHGEMGAGKTRFAQGVAAALGVTAPVCSPTFGIAHLYESPRGRMAHLDLYRLPDEAAVEAFGFEEIIAQAAVAVIEWPERAGGLLPKETIHINIDFGKEEGERIVRVECSM